MNDLAVGFDFQWSGKEITSQYNSEFNRLGFIGLWARYYIPFFGTGLAMYPEASLGYGNYKTEIDYKSMISSVHSGISADGFAYNIGLGVTRFISNNIAFEITGRYQGGTLTGERDHTYEENSHVEIELANIDILFGIMIYLK